MEHALSVHHPLGRATVEQREPQPRLKTLDGRTIAFVWSHGFRGDEMFEILAPLLHERYRDLRFVGYEGFGNIHGDQEREVVAALPGRLREAGADAAIVGVAA